MSRGRPEAISPTAHYTGTVWARNGLSHPALETRRGRLMFAVLEPAMLASRIAGQPTFEGGLLARHRLIDHLLEEAIEDGRVGQVIEIASGLSGRGWRFARRHGAALTYIESDLPDMAEHKRAALADAGTLGERHRVADLDAFRDQGRGSLAELAAELDPDRGLAVIAEGLLNYFDRDSVTGLWGRIASVLRGFPHGLHLADLYLAEDYGGLLKSAAMATLGVFVQGRMHMHFADDAEAIAALSNAGFAEVELHRASEHSSLAGKIEPASARLVRIVDARTSSG